MTVPVGLLFLARADILVATLAGFSRRVSLIVWFLEQQYLGPLVFLPGRHCICIVSCDPVQTKSFQRAVHLHFWWPYEDMEGDLHFNGVPDGAKTRTGKRKRASEDSDKISMPQASSGETLLYEPAHLDEEQSHGAEDAEATHADRQLALFLGLCGISKEAVCTEGLARYCSKYGYGAATERAEILPQIERELEAGDMSRIISFFRHFLEEGFEPLQQSCMDGFRKSDTNLQKMRNSLQMQITRSRFITWTRTSEIFYGSSAYFWRKLHRAPVPLLREDSEQKFLSVKYYLPKRSKWLEACTMLFCPTKSKHGTRNCVSQISMRTGCRLSRTQGHARKFPTHMCWVPPQRPPPAAVCNCDSTTVRHSWSRSAHGRYRLSQYRMWLIDPHKFWRRKSRR